MGRRFNQPLPITSPPYLPSLYSNQEHYWADALGVGRIDENDKKFIEIYKDSIKAT
jgi:hypothetical protein